MSRRRAPTAAEKLHEDWLGMLQPEGLVVSIPVLVEADAYVRQPGETQERIRALTPDDRLDREGFDALCADVLGWPAARRADPAALDALAVPLPELGVVLRPDAALLDKAGAPLVYVAWSPAPARTRSPDEHAPDEHALDEPCGDTHWPVSRHGRFERLLLESQGTGPSGFATGSSGFATGAGAAIGLHACPTAVRVTYAPRGEAPGSLTFPIDALCAWDGRVLVDALVMLLGRDRLFTVPADRRLGALLRASRQRQEKVTEALAGQVEEALQLLVAGLDVANRRTRGALLRGYATADVRAGLVSVLLRLVFLLYCEDQGVLPAHENPFYYENYSIARLADQLAEDRVLYPEAMRHRYGAWARLCALFRLVWAGARHRDLLLPARQGELFDPSKHPFLEGRPAEQAVAGDTARGELPPIDDGVIDDVLERLVFLEGQRISYRNLDVEQIGSVYEGLMGLELRRAASRALPLRGGGWIELGDLWQSEQPATRVAEAAGLKPAELHKRVPGLAAWRPTGDPTVDLPALQALLDPLLHRDLAPRDTDQHYVTAGSERRRTGSHYTPTSLTRPIVERTLGPVLDALGRGPPGGGGPSRAGTNVATSAQILGLKVCDPAMGSGAFLAEACRYLARRLLDAWTREGRLPDAARATDPLLVARRMVAERCLYGVDKNPFAVEIARLSLWLVTLSKDLPFTFVDHALRVGDAVIGLSTAQIGGFSFEGGGGGQLFAHTIKRAIKDAVRDRAQINEPDLFSWKDKTRALKNADGEVYSAARRGDLLLAAVWAGGTEKQLKERVRWLHPAVDAWFLSDGDDRLPEAAETLLAALPMRPFHWELEFPEVFARENPGFDAVVGNPPFGGKNNITATGGDGYIKLFQRLHPHVHGNADLASYFFLRAADVLRKGACFGLVSTNTIKQGDTRATGLQHLVANGITLYDATTDMVWPVSGAAVVVDVVHGARGGVAVQRRLNGTTVGEINSALEGTGELADPIALAANNSRAFIGSYVLGKGFFLEITEARELLDQDPRNALVIKPFLGGEELNSNPRLQPERCVIDLGKHTLSEAADWPAALDIVRHRVKPERDTNNRAPRRDNWWWFGERAPALYRAVAPLHRALALSSVSKHHLVAFVEPTWVFSHALAVFAFDDWFSFAVLQSRVHQFWARNANLGSTMKTDARYTPSTCFETFPFPRPTDAQRVAVAAAGQELYEHRSALMLHFDEGMTRIWNRLLHPDETDLGVLRLRELRDAMDRAVLDAYGWPDLAPDDTAAIVKQLRALNAERAAEEKRRG